MRDAQLCDFGLALWAAEAASPVTGDDVAGKFGFVAAAASSHLLEEFK